MDSNYWSSSGSSGVCFTYEAATHSKRKFFVSTEFAAAEKEIYDVVKDATGRRSSKWKVLKSILYLFQRTSTFLYTTEYPYQHLELCLVLILKMLVHN